MSATDPNTQSALADCPFCGAAATLLRPLRTAPYVLCTKCHCGGPVSSTADEIEAIAAWNTRAHPPATGEAWAYGWIDAGGRKHVSPHLVTVDRLDEGCELIPLYAAPVAGRGGRSAVAEAVHKGRFPADREPTPFADEDAGGRAYCFRIADSVLALSAPTSVAGVEVGPLDRQPDALRDLSDHLWNAERDADSIEERCQFEYWREALDQLRKDAPASMAGADGTRRGNAILELQEQVDLSGPHANVVAIQMWAAREILAALASTAPPPQGDLAVAIRALERIASSEAFDVPQVIDGPLAEEMRARMTFAAEALRTLTEKEA